MTKLAQFLDHNNKNIHGYQLKWKPKVFEKCWEKNPHQMNVVLPIFTHTSENTMQGLPDFGDMTISIY